MDKQPPGKLIPEKLILEPTTRCNFKCGMCVKQSQGCRIPEGEMGTDVFQALVPLLPGVRTLTLTGIGEPLLHTGLESCISRARDAMPDHGTIGFQTNGKLLNRERALSLVRSGLNKICISMDAWDPGLFSSLRQGGSLDDVAAAVDALNLAVKEVPGSRVRTGIEFVLMKRNLDQLPKVVDWAGRKGIDFILVTHVTAYDPLTESQQAFMDNSREGLDLFEHYRRKAAARDVDITQYNRVRWKLRQTPEDRAVYNIVMEMKEKALDKGLYVNLFHLMSEDGSYYSRLAALMEEARQTADRHGIRLRLPENRPRVDRYCPFIEEKAMFVSWDGEVSPCYFLWHGYQTMRQGYAKTVNPMTFGNVLETDPLFIWNSRAYSGFRDKVGAYDYPNCHSWCETRCDYVLDDPFYQDCFINDIPCCDCHWNLGFLNCLN